MHVGVFQALPGRSMDMPPGEPRTWARLKFHAGWSGWTRPPTMAGGGGGVGQLRRVCKGVEGVFKGI